jgi:hypothetical protein
MSTRTDLAAEAFIYGFPLVFDLEQVDRFTRSGMGGVPPTPLNTFGHAGVLAGPDDTFVSINNDTIYSIAQLDVSGGPVRLDVPDAHGRYYVLQFIDAWTNNFAYVGHRATGTGAGSFLLVAPDWQGDAAETVIRCPTTIATIVGRWAVAGEDDLPAVRALQAGLTLTPTAGGRGLPQPDPAVPEQLRFLEQLRTWMQAFPPASRDVAYQERFAPIGLLGEAYTQPDAELAAGLAAGRERMEAALEHAGDADAGWHVDNHMFDYNLDFFEVGAIDAPEWKITDPERRLLVRALAARGGLWGNHAYEAAYSMTYKDAAGELLQGDRHYALRFETQPPVAAFWSVTMYSLPDFYLVENPLGRYSIGDRTPGLRYGDDGSLTLTIQHDEPGDTANWLPAPAGRFRPILRMYEPEASVLDGSYRLPPITRVSA